MSALAPVDEMLTLDDGHTRVGNEVIHLICHCVLDLQNKRAPNGVCGANRGKGTNKRSKADCIVCLYFSFCPKCKCPLKLTY